MTEDRIIEILMKEASSKLSIEEHDLLTRFQNENAGNSSFIAENRSVLSMLPDFSAEAAMFNTESALTNVKSLIQPEATIHTLEPTKKIRTINWQRYAAAAMFLIGMSTLAYTFLGRTSGEMVYITNDAPQTISLSDGSQVTLNSNSTLTLSEEFGTKLRDMRLEGEAYFKVKNNDNQPFTVQASGLEVEVLGTEFNVNNNPSLEHITVFVTEGKVKVSSLTTRTKVLLQANESARYLRTTKALTKDATARINATSWLTSKLRFENVSLSEALAEIEAHFNIQVMLEKPSLSDCKYTSLFNNAKPEEVLETLSAVFDFQLVEQGSSNYQLLGGKCN